MRLALPLLTSVFLACRAAPQHSDARSVDSVLFRPAAQAIGDTTVNALLFRFVSATATHDSAIAYHETSEPLDSFAFTVRGQLYVVRSDGRGRSQRGGEWRSLRVPLDTAMELESLAYLDYDGDPILVCEESDGDYGNGFVLRLDAHSLQPRWRASIPGFNVGTALRVDSALYATSIGFAGRLELTRGTWTWQRDDLYAHGAYNSFHTPYLSGENVVFVPNEGATLSVHR